MTGPLSNSTQRTAARSRRDPQQSRYAGRTPGTSPGIRSRWRSVGRTDTGLNTERTPAETAGGSPGRSARCRTAATRSGQCLPAIQTKLDRPWLVFHFRNALRRIPERQRLARFVPVATSSIGRMHANPAEPCLQGMKHPETSQKPTCYGLAQTSILTLRSVSSSSVSRHRHPRPALRTVPGLAGSIPWSPGHSIDF